jgi:chemotaxis protein histidine kinase CheA
VDQKQQIIGYFVEEAREHMETIEKGILNLQASCDDPEQMNELFRAAHSVKGGANMLGFAAIGHVAHRMEDCFKILKESPVPIDRQVEDLFLKGFDGLQDLLGTIGTGNEAAQGEQTSQRLEPVFVQLQTYLEKLTGQAPRLPDNFNAQVMGVLRDMLALFKQPESAATRQKLQSHCDQLTQVGAASEQWCTLTQTAKRALGNPQATFKILAPLIITELKESAQKAQAGQGASIQPSVNLQKLGGSAPAAPKAPPAAATPATPAAATPAAPATPAVGPNEVVIPKDPKGAAQVLVKTFDRKQLTELAQILVKVIKG